MRLGIGRIEREHLRALDGLGQREADPRVPGRDLDRLRAGAPSEAITSKGGAPSDAATSESR
ncbi:hypothetical protein [Chenggangzhangella methanolivorans]|uniref:hypothetical protein n=1 Tax=Chenggangzhangella methanolivorans TaxID=1437009 RepID=UPI0021BD42B6|nr:hypothetical protein [Chenggangzhangella methanolivorans]